MWSVPSLCPLLSSPVLLGCWFVPVFSKMTLAPCWGLLALGRFQLVEPELQPVSCSSVTPLLEGHLSRRQPPPICGPEPAPVGLTGRWQCSPPASGRVTLASLNRFSDFPVSGVLSFLPHLLLSFQCSFWSGGAPWVEEDTVHLGQAVKQGATGFSLGSVIVACLGSAILAGWFYKSKVGQAYQLCLVWGHSCFQSMS